MQTDIEDEATKGAIRQFVMTYNVDCIDGKDSALAKQIDNKLIAVKICDPAVGSGAFPMGLLKELFLCRGAIEAFDNAVEIKRHIILNNIYGVDIEAGAVDIARLRFWLALIIDEKSPEALPNMDFKIMQGNSLLEQYNGVDLSQLNYTKSKKDKKCGVQISFFDNLADMNKKQFSTLLAAYFKTDNHEEKERLRHAIKDCVQCQLDALGYNVDLSDVDICGNSEFFLWHTWFADVFDNGGFDIVIGNPPYVVMPKENPYKFYKTYKSLDLYAYFFEQSQRILKDKGCLTFITPNLYIKTIKFESLRTFLENKLGRKEIKMVGDKVFHAVVPTCISIFINQQSNWSFGDLIEGASIISKMAKDSVELATISNIQRGFEVGRDKVVEMGDYPMLTGTTVEKYTYKKIMGISEDTYREFAKDEYYYSGERLLIRETGSSLMVLYLDEKIYTNRSLYTIKIKDKRYNTKFILGCLCSKAISYYYVQKFKTETELFPKIRIAQAKKLPIPQASNVNQEQMIGLVEKILSIKKQNIQADTSTLESQIDQLVYKLYDLTPEEIAIVEGTNN